MSMDNLIKYSDNYSKRSGSLWQYCKHKANDNIANSEPFRSNTKITGNISDADNKKMLQ